MKKILFAVCSAALLAACSDAGNSADTKKDTTATSSTSTSSMDAKPKARPDSATMMKNWMAYATPGDVHKMMTSWNGTWTGKVRMWQVPGGPMDSSVMTTVNKMIMGGRYQVGTSTGTMMGAPFEGMSTVGYDNGTKMFTSTWIDNMGTGFMTMQGTWDDATKTISFKGKMVDPTSGDGSMVDVRETFKIVDENTQLMEMFAPGPDGKEFKNMEITFTRKK